MNKILIDILGIVLLYIDIGFIVLVAACVVDSINMIRGIKSRSLYASNLNSASTLKDWLKALWHGVTEDIAFGLMCVFVWPFIVYFNVYKWFHRNG